MSTEAVRMNPHNLKDSVIPAKAGIHQQSARMHFATCSGFRVKPGMTAMRYFSH